MVMRPLPKALCWTLSPARKAGAAALGGLPAAGLFQSGAGALEEGAADSWPREKPRS